MKIEISEELAESLLALNKMQDSMALIELAEIIEVQLEEDRIAEEMELDKGFRSSIEVAVDSLEGR